MQDAAVSHKALQHHAAGGADLDNERIELDGRQRAALAQQFVGVLVRCEVLGECDAAEVQGLQHLEPLACRGCRRTLVNSLNPFQILAQS